MPLFFEWDEDKAESNRRKHGVTFEEAQSAFADPSGLLRHDVAHNLPDEERLVLLGSSIYGRIIVVSHCDRGERIRIISARPATAKERQTYERRKL